MIWLFQTNTLSLRCVFHSIRFKVNNFGSQRRAFFYAPRSTKSIPPFFIIILHIAAHAVVIHIILRCRIKASHIVMFMIFFS